MDSSLCTLGHVQEREFWQLLEEVLGRSYGRALAHDQVLDRLGGPDAAEAVMERYTQVLKPMHLQFIEPCKRYADLIVPEGGSNAVAIDILTMYIKKHLKNEE